MAIDASLAVKWLVEEPSAQQALDLARSWRHDSVSVVAPFLSPVEVINALNRKAIRQLISMEEAARLAANLWDLGVQFRKPRELHKWAITLAVELQQNAVYDAHYLALAQSLECDLWTADKRFHQAAADDFPRVHLVGEM